MIIMSVFSDALALGQILNFHDATLFMHITKFLVCVVLFGIVLFALAEKLDFVLEDKSVDVNETITIRSQHTVCI